jgi:hypothetical protein
MRILNQVPLAAIVLFSGVTIAAEPVDPDTLPRVDCSSLRYSHDFLQSYPKAPAACLEARVYKGETYMKVKAKVYVSDEPMLSVALMDPYGDTLGTVLVRKPLSLRVLVNGKEVDVFDLHRDEELTFWVPESMFSAQPVAAKQ